MFDNQGGYYDKVYIFISPFLYCIEKSCQRCINVLN